MKAFQQAFRFRSDVVMANADDKVDTEAPRVTSTVSATRYHGASKPDGFCAASNQGCHTLDLLTQDRDLKVVNEAESKPLHPAEATAGTTRATGERIRHEAHVIKSPGTTLQPSLCEFCTDAMNTRQLEQRRYAFISTEARSLIQKAILSYFLAFLNEVWSEA
jgi:hypothetical protein